MSIAHLCFRITFTSGHNFCILYKYTDVLMQFVDHSWNSTDGIVRIKLD